MIKLLTKLFIKDHENVTSAAVRRAYGTMCSLYGIFLNLLLFAGKYIAGLISGSVAITADEGVTAAIESLGERLDTMSDMTALQSDLDAIIKKINGMQA